MEAFLKSDGTLEAEDTPSNKKSQEQFLFIKESSITKKTFTEENL